MNTVKCTPAFKLARQTLQAEKNNFKILTSSNITKRTFTTWSDSWTPAHTSRKKAGISRNRQLKVSKGEILDLLDSHDFYTTKPLRVGDLGTEIKNFCFHFWER